MASSPFIAGFLGGTSIRTVFFVDLAMMAILAAIVYRNMTETIPLSFARAPLVPDQEQS
jgi:hypothetical protein